MSRYSITVCEYAVAPEFPESTLVHGAGGQRRTPFSFGIIEGEGHLCLVDTGIGRSEAQARVAEKQGVVDRMLAEDRLGELGFRAEDVGTVLITHAHFDHFGNVAAFPNATVYLQRRELEGWLWAMSLPDQLGYFNESVDPGTLKTCVDLLVEGRLRLVEGDVEDVLPGVDLRAAHDTHTFGSMWVAVRGGGSDPGYVFPGDNVYVYENVGGLDGGGNMVPIGHAVCGNLAQMVSAREMVSAAGGLVSRVLPFHEARLADLYPTGRNRLGLGAVEVCR